MFVLPAKNATRMKKLCFIIEVVLQDVHQCPVKLWILSSKQYMWTFQLIFTALKQKQNVSETEKKNNTGFHH